MRLWLSLYTYNIAQLAERNKKYFKWQQEYKLPFLLQKNKKRSTNCVTISTINVSPNRKEVEMSPRNGRPPSKDPKRHETRIRMSDSDIEKLEYCCKVTGLTKADVIRRGIDLVYAETKK